VHVYFSAVKRFKFTFRFFYSFTKEITGIFNLKSNQPVMKKFLPFLFFAAFVFKTSEGFAQATNVSDSLALIDLYNSTNGPNWPSTFQWTLTDPVTTWASVTVSNGRVVSLFYPGGGSMKGAIPSSIGNLTALTDLDMDDSLNGSIPSTIGNLVNLTRLNLQLNQLTGSIPTSIGNLTNLTTLLLGNNKLSGSLPASLSNLTKLQLLELQFNQLSDSIPAVLDHLPALTYLDLNNNQFTFSGMEGIATGYSSFGSSLGYVNQKTLPLDQTAAVLSVSAGGTLGNNTYTWYKNYLPVATIVGDSTYTMSNTGIYSVAVTNAIATQLTLYSDTITVTSLPVSFTSFTAVRNNNENLLQWSLIQQANSNYFNVQRSTDAVNFTTIGKVNASGNTTAQQNYSYTDNAFTTANTVYYRLQETDKNGISIYSKIVSLQMNQKGIALTISPNPVKDVLNMIISNVAGNASLYVFDANGKKLLEQNQTIQQGSSLSINTAGFAAGTYFIHVVVNGTTFDQKFVKE